MTDQIVPPNVHQDTFEEALQQGEQFTPHNQTLYQQEMEQYRDLYALQEYLASIYGQTAPTVEQLIMWKNSYGRFYLSNVVDEDDIYIFRTIQRQEWKKFVLDYSRASDDDRQQGLISICLLFPSKDVVAYNKPAGYLPALETQIMYQSGFLDDATLLSSIKVVK